jgi:hypothetical protein
VTTDSLPLFASEPFDVKDAALAIRARLVPVAQGRPIDVAFEQDVARMVPIAVELLDKAEQQGQSGIAANDVRTIAEGRRILLASTAQRYLARVGRVVMLRAGFVPVGRAKTPRIGNRGGNDVILWGRRRVA